MAPPEASGYGTVPLARAHLDLTDYQLATVATALEIAPKQPATMTAGILLALA